MIRALGSAAMLERLRGFSRLASPSWAGALSMILFAGCVGAVGESTASQASYLEDAGSGSGSGSGSNVDAGTGMDGGSGSGSAADADAGTDSGSGSGSGCYAQGTLRDGDSCACDTDCASGRCDRWGTCRSCDGVYDYTTIDAHRANKAAYVPPGTYAPWLPVHSTMLLVVHEVHWEEEWHADLDECDWIDRSPSPTCVQFLNHGTNALTPARQWQGSCPESGALCELAMTAPAGCTCEPIAASVGENDDDPRNVCPGAQPQYRYGMWLGPVGSWSGSDEDADHMLSVVDGCDCDGITPFLDEAHIRGCIDDAITCLGSPTDQQTADAFGCMQEAQGSGAEPSDTTRCPISCSWVDAASSLVSCIANMHVCNDDESLREDAFLRNTCSPDRSASCSSPDIFGYW